MAMSMRDILQSEEEEDEDEKGEETMKKTGESPYFIRPIINS